MTTHEQGTAVESGPPNPPQLLEDLTSFDPALSERVWSLKLGYLAGPALGPDLEEAYAELDTEALQGHLEVIDAYQWATVLAVYPYRDRDDLEEVRGTAVMGLIEAVHSHKQNQETDFLVHLSGVLDAKMAATYGAPAEAGIPTPAEFDDFVGEHYLSALPPLPSNRKAEYLAIGSEVLVMEDGCLVPGIVLSSDTREDVPPIIMNTIPEADRPALQERIDQAYTQLQAEGSYITLGDEGASADEKANYEDLMNPPAELGTPRVEDLHMTGNGPRWLYALHPQMIRNPDSIPTVSVATEQHPGGVERKVRNEFVVAFGELEAMVEDPLYREAYLDSMTEIDETARQLLENALQHLEEIEAAAQVAIAAIGAAIGEPSRARVHHRLRKKAKFDLVREYF